MGPDSERLYRDDVGASLERIRRLEEENQALRTEIDRIKSGRPLELPSTYRVGVIALSIATIAVGATLAFSNGGSAPPEPPPVVVVQSPLVLPTATAVPPVSPVVVTAAPALRPPPRLPDTRY